MFVGFSDIATKLRKCKFATGIIIIMFVNAGQFFLGKHNNY